MMQLTPIAPYDFTLTFRAGRAMYVMTSDHEGALRRVVRVGDALALVEVRSLGTTAEPHLEASILTASGTLDEAALWIKVERILNLSDDLKPFYAQAKRDPVLEQTVAMLYGLHTLQADSLFEAVALTIIEQQISFKLAQIAERWLIHWGGESLDYEGETYYAFPRPERIAAASIADLTPLKITKGRMQRLIDLATMAETLEDLRDQPHEIAYETLIGFKGVGHWTAVWTLLRAQGRHRYVGASDVALRAAVNTYYFGQTGRADVPIVTQTFDQYGEFNGIAAYYILARWAFEHYNGAY
jgi:DNA-3-methyladenine glycosylase II